MQSENIFSRDGFAFLSYGNRISLSRFGILPNRFRILLDAFEILSDEFRISLDRFRILLDAFGILLDGFGILLAGFRISRFCTKNAPVVETEKLIV